MSNSYVTDVYLKKLYHIHEQCASVREKAKESSKPVDEFNRRRQILATDIRETKKKIDQIATAGASDVYAARENYELRVKVKEIKEQIEALEKLQNKNEKKIMASRDPSEDQMVVVNYQKEIVENAWVHFKRLENAERYRDYGGDDKFGEKDYESESEGLYGTIPELDDPRFEFLTTNEKKIDEGLKEITSALKIVRTIAESMDKELKLQDEILANVDKNTEVIVEKLDGVNESLKKTLKKIRGPRECLCNSFLCFLILGILSCILYLVIVR